MKPYFAAMLSLLVVSTLRAQLPYAQEQVIEYAKSIDVRTLDPSLPSQRLEDWLQSGPPRAHIGNWSVEGTCDVKPDDPNLDYPLCVEVTFSRDGEGGQFLVQVGTSRSGIVGRPRLYYGIGVREAPFVITGQSQRLSDLPALLDEPAVAGGVQRLYEEIVATHPVGMPTDAEMAKLRPFLSHRLTERLRTARDCEKDYLRQRPATEDAAKPAWMRSGVFTGDGQRVSPIQAVAERKEPQKDGSFLVYLSLVHLYTGHGSDYFHFAGRKAQGWEVVATVVSENGRFVVDDVRMFDDDETGTPSHKLSDAFSGCEGPRWVGLAATKQH